MAMEFKQSVLMVYVHKLEVEGKTWLDWLLNRPMGMDPFIVMCDL